MLLRSTRCQKSPDRAYRMLLLAPAACPPPLLRESACPSKSCRPRPHTVPTSLPQCSRAQIRKAHPPPRKSRKPCESVVPLMSWTCRCHHHVPGGAARAPHWIPLQCPASVRRPWMRRASESCRHRHHLSMCKQITKICVSGGWRSNHRPGSNTAKGHPKDATPNARAVPAPLPQCAPTPPRKARPPPRKSRRGAQRCHLRCPRARRPQPTGCPRLPSQTSATHRAATITTAVAAATGRHPSPSVATDHRVATTGHQPPATRHQPPATSHHAPPICHQRPATAAAVIAAMHLPGHCALHRGGLRVQFDVLPREKCEIPSSI